MMSVMMCGLLGLILGACVYLVFGFLIGRWDGGTVLLVGLVVGLISCLSAIISGWSALYVVFGLSGALAVVFTGSYFLNR